MNQPRATLRKGNQSGLQGVKEEGVHTGVSGSLKGQKKGKACNYHSRICPFVYPTSKNK